MACISIIIEMILLQTALTSGVCSLAAEFDLPHRLRNPLRLAFEQRPRAAAHKRAAARPEPNAFRLTVLMTQTDDEPNR